MPDPIAILMDEHRVIEHVLTALELAQERDDVPVSFYERAVDFIAHFADGCHHEKEEEALFPALERQGLPRDGGPIGVMLHEHERGRDCVRRLRAAIDDESIESAKDAAREYTALLRSHIAKEDQVLFPMARDVLPDDVFAGLAKRFDSVETDACDARYRTLAADLLDEMGG